MEEDIPYDAIDAPLFYLACRRNDVSAVLELIGEANDSVSESNCGGNALASFWGGPDGDGRKLPIHEALSPVVNPNVFCCQPISGLSSPLST